MSLIYKIYIKSDEEEKVFLQSLEQIFGVAVQPPRNLHEDFLGTLIKSENFALCDIMKYKYRSDYYEIQVYPAGNLKHAIMKREDQENALNYFWETLKESGKYAIMFSLNSGNIQRTFDPEKSENT